MYIYIYTYMYRYTCLLACHMNATIPPLHPTLNHSHSSSVASRVYARHMKVIVPPHPTQSRYRKSSTTPRAIFHPLARPTCSETSTFQHTFLLDPKMSRGFAPNGLLWNPKQWSSLPLVIWHKYEAIALAIKLWFCISSSKHTKNDGTSPFVYGHINDFYGRVSVCKLFVYQKVSHFLLPISKIWFTLTLCLFNVAMAKHRLG